MRALLRRHPTTHTEFFGVKRPGSPVLAVVMLVVFAVGWGGNDVRSCQRSNGVRAGARTYFVGVGERSLARARIESGAARALDVKAAKSAAKAAQKVSKLNCGLPFPDTH